MRDQSLYLKDILRAIESIETFTAGVDFDTFRADDKTASAVIRKLEIIGETVKQIPEEQVAGMRDKLIHFYSASTPPLSGKPSTIVFHC